MNRAFGLGELVRHAFLLMRDVSDCQSLGIRLKSNEDFPYLETLGFPPEFLDSENTLGLRNDRGEPVYARDGRRALKCLCGKVLSRSFDPNTSFFTKQGSFWANSTEAMVASSLSADPGPGLCRCYVEGYASMALVPLTYGHENIGLLQFNDYRPHRFNQERISLLEELAGHLSNRFIPYFT